MIAPIARPLTTNERVATLERRYTELEIAFYILLGIVALMWVLRR